MKLKNHIHHKIKLSSHFHCANQEPDDTQSTQRELLNVWLPVEIIDRELTCLNFFAYSTYKPRLYPTLKSYLGTPDRLSCLEREERKEVCSRCIKAQGSRAVIAFSYGKFTRTLLVMKSKPNNLSTIGITVEQSVLGRWMLSFNWSKYRRGRWQAGWLDWQGSISGAYQTPCLQLSSPSIARGMWFVHRSV